VSPNRNDLDTWKEQKSLALLDQSEIEYERNLAANVPIERMKS